MTIQLSKDWKTVKLGEIFKLSSGKFLPKKDLIAGEYPVYGGNGINGCHNLFFVKEPTLVIGRVGEYCGAVHITKPNAWITDNALYATEYLQPVSTTYLYYLLNKIDLNKYAKVAGQPSISQGIIANIPVPLPPLETQHKIVSILDEADNLRKLRKQADDKMKELIPALFDEMFGDPVTNPKGWEVKKLEDVCALNPPKPTLDDETEVTFLPMSSVTEDGLIADPQIKMYSEVKKGYTAFAENDVLFAKITPCMENGKGAIARNLVNSYGFGSTEFHVLRVNKAILPELIFSYLSFKPIRKYAEQNMVGSAGQKRVPQSFLEKLKIPIPPMELQQEFTRFVRQLESGAKIQTKRSNLLDDLFNSLMDKCINGDI